MKSGNIWNRVFKNGPGKICERHPLKNSQAYPVKFFKGCLPQILLRPFLYTLTHLFVLILFTLNNGQAKNLSLLEGKKYSEINYD